MELRVTESPICSETRENILADWSEALSSYCSGAISTYKLAIVAENCMGRIFQPGITNLYYTSAEKTALETTLVRLRVAITTATQSAFAFMGLAPEQITDLPSMYEQSYKVDMGLMLVPRQLRDIFPHQEAFLAETSIAMANRHIFTLCSRKNACDSFNYYREADYELARGFEERRIKAFQQLST